MRLHIRHTTRYSYDQPVPHALLQLRLRPKETTGQRLIDWRLDVTGGKRELGFEDWHRNSVDLIAADPGATELVLHVEGQLETTDTNGVIGVQGGFAPLWLFCQQSNLTRPGATVKRIAQAVAGEKDVLAQMHLLMDAVAEAVVWEVGQSAIDTTAEDAATAGKGVCQDMAHVFIAAARHLGVPARYVSGYLMMPDRVEQDATHAWAEAHVGGLGWVGFDIANRISPDAAYVRTATGLDYAEAAPVSGTRAGTGRESLSVSVAVEQIQQ